MTANRVFAILAVLLSSVPINASLDRTECRDATVPAFMSKGVNHIDKDSTRPLFELKVIPRENAGISQVYEVIIVARSQAHAFTDATIVISTNGKCGKGNLQYDSKDFFQVQQEDSCPEVLYTNRKTPMSSLPRLLWTPPSCGCVQLRAVLILAAGKYYYAESDGVITGHLAKRICVQEKRIEMTREQRLDALCHMSEKRTSREILSSAAFKNRHQLDIHYTDRLELEMALEMRKADARMCCSIKKSQGEKLNCFETARYRRVDRFCQDGYPDIPFVTFRSTFMRSKERRCCTILGTYRYLCFAKDNQLLPGSSITPMDHSLDATDLVNDLAELCTLEDFNVYLGKLQNASKPKPKQEVWPAKEILEGDNDKSAKYLSKTQTASIDAVSKTNVSEIHRTLAAQVPTSTEKPSVRQPQPSRSIKNLRTVSQATTSTNPPTTVAEKSSQTNNNNNNNNNEPLSPQLNRYNSDITRRHPTDTKPYRFAKASSERRKYRRKMGGGRSNPSGAFRRSDERKARRRSSVERRLQKENVGASREQRRGSRRFASAENRLRGRPTVWKKEPLDETTHFMEDFDDEGGRSVKETMSYLELKMKRLELRRLCCQAGARFGGEVYGSLSVVNDECVHSSYKHLERQEITFGVQKCQRQFVKCCVDEAKMGLTMSSSEFRNKAYDTYFDNFRRTAPVKNDDETLTRRGVARKGRNNQPETSGRVTDEFRARETLDTESDRRFESMRAAAGDPRFGLGDDLDEDEEYTGPRRFDDEDNRDASGITDGGDVMTTSSTVADKRKTVVVPERKSKVTKGRNIGPSRKDETPDENDGDDDEEKKEEEEEEEKKKEEENDEGKKEVKEEKESDGIIDQFEDDILSGKLFTNDKLQATLKKADSQGTHKTGSQLLRSPYRRSSRERSNGGLSRNSRRNRSRSRSSRRREGGSSRRRFRYDNNQNRRPHRTGKRKRPIRRHKTPVAMDSQEMAAANEKYLLPALDSKEMAEQYSQQDNGVIPHRYRTHRFRTGGLSKRRRRLGKQLAYNF